MIIGTGRVVALLRPCLLAKRCVGFRQAAKAVVAEESSSEEDSSDDESSSDEVSPHIAARWLDDLNTTYSSFNLSCNRLKSSDCMHAF